MYIQANSFTPSELWPFTAQSTSPTPGIALINVHNKPPVPWEYHYCTLRYYTYLPGQT